MSAPVATAQETIASVKSTEAPKPAAPTPQTSPPPVAVVVPVAPVIPIKPATPAPAVSSIKLTPAGIELTNPTIILPNSIFVDGNQVDKIKPAFALIVHGAIVIAEKNLVLPIAGSVIRS